MSPKPAVLLACASLLLAAAAQGATVSIEERLRQLEQGQAELRAEVREKEQRIRDLEAQLQDPTLARAPAPIPVPEPESGESPGSTGAVVLAPAPTATTPGRFDMTPKAGWGHYEPGRGFVVARTGVGELDLSAYASFRYVNQTGLAETYTNSFGDTRDLDLRSDAQFQKVLLYFKGWALDPKLRYLLYTWTANTSQGQGAQVVVAGNLSYAFNPMLDVGVGIGGLPSTRSTSGNFPNWLRSDSRTIADDYFRGSYTTGIWSSGKLGEGVSYQVMLGNNLSQLGVDAGQLDNVFNTFSAALWWNPTTGEFGPRNSFGDFEYHEDLATRFGLHYTRSREDSQNQPGTEDPDNAQLRISDGTIIFTPDAFGAGTRIDKATYQMVALEAGLKYRGYALEGEYYWRRLDDFGGQGTLPFDDLWDHGFQLQASTMLLPETLQAYLSGSQIFGEYGDPWDVGVGLNWFPYRTKNLRANAQVLFLDESPVGNNASPQPVGADGVVYSVDLELNF